MMKGILFITIGVPCAMILSQLAKLKEYFETKTDADKLYWIPWTIIYIIGLPFSLVLEFLEKI